MRTYSTIIGICLLAGCTMFSRPVASSRPTNADLQLFATGDWCRVEMAETRSGLSSRSVEYIGRIKWIDREIITLTDVTTQTIIDNAYARVPYLNRVFASTGGKQDQSEPATLPRDKIARITRISAQQASDLKQPMEKMVVGIPVEDDFEIPDGRGVQAIGIDFENTEP